MDLLPNVKSAFNAKKTCKLLELRTRLIPQSERLYLEWLLLNDSKTETERVIQKKNAWPRKFRIAKMRLSS